eukprot:766248-Pleurochrysis_carterae.AAC.3
MRKLGAIDEAQGPERCVHERALAVAGGGGDGAGAAGAHGRDAAAHRGAILRRRSLRCARPIDRALLPKAALRELRRGRGCEDARAPLPPGARALLLSKLRMVFEWRVCAA